MASPTILLVDDSEDARYVLAVYFEHHGYRVLHAGDGAEAVRMARVNRPDAIIMDLAMPVVDGWSACELLRHASETRSIPIIAFTAQMFLEDVHERLARSFDGYIAKPANPESVLREIERLIRPPNPLGRPLEAE